MRSRLSTTITCARGGNGPIRCRNSSQRIGRRWKRRERNINRTPTFLIGKSMGGRIGCHVSLEEKVDGLVCLGYPLCAMGDRTKLRDEVLRALTTPILFVQGTRDALCPLDLLERVRADMKAPNFLHVVEGGDHSLACAEATAQGGGRNAGRCRSKNSQIDRRLRFKSAIDVIPQAPVKATRGLVALQKHLPREHAKTHISFRGSFGSARRLRIAF